MAQDKGLALPLQGLGHGGWKESRVGQSPRWLSAQLASPLPLTSETVPLAPLTLVFGDQGGDFLIWGSVFRESLRETCHMSE